MRSKLPDEKVLNIIDLSNWIFRITGYQTEARLKGRWDVIEKTTAILVAISSEISRLTVDKESISDTNFRRKLVEELFDSDSDRIDKFLGLLDASNKGTFYDLFLKDSSSK